MYLPNKYTKWYNSIIESAKNRVLEGYKERHHIIPISLGGPDIDSNIAELTAREHFVCHLLLTKMTKGNDKYKMNFALSMMMKVQNIGEGRYAPPTSRLYEYAKKIFKESLAKFWTEENRSIHAQKISKSTKGRKLSEEIKEKYRKKTWTEKALQNRLKNCLESAAKRKGKPNPEHGERIFKNYVNRNKEVIFQIWELFDSGMNRRKIAQKLGISWDRVDLSINKREKIKNII